MASAERKAVKKTYDQRFRPEWLQQKDFEDWLVGPTKANKEPRCAICNKDVPCHRSALLKYCGAQVHLNNLKSKLNTASTKDVFQQQSIKKDYREKTVVQFSAFIVEHNLPFALVNPLLSLIQSSAPTYSSEKTALSQIYLNTTKCTNIIRQGTGLYFASILTKKL